MCAPERCDGVCVDDQCVATRWVFVSSSLQTGSLGGLDGADAICQELAGNAGLDGVFMAWLSDTTGSPATRMVHDDRVFTLVDGTVVAEGWDDLTDGDLFAPIDRDEFGEPAPFIQVCVGGEVWTNTTVDGFAVGTDACGNWDTMEFATLSHLGLLGSSDFNWTNTTSCRNTACGSPLPIYCFEQ